MSKYLAINNYFCAINLFMESTLFVLRRVYRLKATQILLKLALFAGLLLLLFYQLREGLERMPAKDDLYFWQKGLTIAETAFLLFAIILMPVNWALEGLKWQALMPANNKIGFTKMSKAVLSGLTFSLFTPNRIGEYGGRVLFVTPEQRLQTVFATIKGSIAQWIAILGGGIFGIIAIICNSAHEEAIGLAYYLLVFAAIILMLMSIFYFKMSSLLKTIVRIPYLKKFAAKLSDKEILKYSNSTLLITLSFAMLRYIVYSLQYLLIIKAFGINNDILISLSAISVIYLLQTGLPIPPTFGLIARGSIAVWIFGMLGNEDFYQQSSILAATFSLWCINLFIPALLGSYFIASRIGKTNLSKDQ
jgi:type IV secretory pathway VirB2 component (pilin)